MSLRVAWTPRAVKEVGRLDARTRERIVTALGRYAESGLGDVIRLTDVHPPEWRLRVGEHRVRFRLREDTLEVLRVANRREVYR